MAYFAFVLNPFPTMEYNSQVEEKEKKLHIKAAQSGIFWR